MNAEPAATASAPPAAAAAARAMANGGSAVDAVIAGFLAAAGAEASVLLSPLTALVAGVGMGARCLDGRSLQPGRDLPRPRGWQKEEEIPAAARIATPRSVATLALLHAYGARLPMSALTRDGATAARDDDAANRALFLETIGQQSATVLRSGEGARALLRAGGTRQGGLLSSADLLNARPGDQALNFVRVQKELEVALPPFEPVNAENDARRAQVLVAADRQGTIAALTYSPDPTGIPIPELELLAPRDAQPIRRAVPRITPGTVRPAPCPIALLRQSNDGWFAAVGVSGKLWLHADDLQFDGGTSLSDQLTALGALKPGHQALASLVQRGRTQLLTAP